MPQPRTDTFQKGESVDTFAERVGTTSEELHKLNTQTSFEAGGVINLPDLPEPEVDNSGIVSSSTGLRDEETDIKQIGQQVINDLGVDSDLIDDATSGVAFSETEEGKQSMQEVEDLRSSIGVLTSAETAKIDAAGNAIGAEYDILIEEAEEQKREGRADALVGAGEKGGLLSTQFAGIAALSRTEGKTFEGSGGKLEEIKGVYDRNISILQSKKIAAVNQAKSSAEKAIRTGKREDLQIAQDAYSFAKEISQESAALAREKIDTIKGLQDMAIKQAQFESTEAGSKSKAAMDQVNFYLDNMGLDYLENNREEIEGLFEDAGYEGFDYDTMISEMREADEAGSWSIMDVGGDKYNVQVDKTGKVISKEIVAYKRYAPSSTSTNKDETIKGTDASEYANTLISDNPDATDEELEAQMRDATNLSADDIKFKLKNRPKKENTNEEIKAALTRDEYEEKLLLSASGEKKIDAAKSSLTKSQKKKIDDKVEEVYGRTFFQKITPGGR